MTNLNARRVNIRPRRFQPQPHSRHSESDFYRSERGAANYQEIDTKTIGVIVPSLSDPFFATFAQAIVTAAKKHNYSVILTISVKSLDMKRRQARLLQRQHVDGLIITSASGTDLYYDDRFSEPHIVTVDESADCSHGDSILSPNRSATQCAVEHLIDHGHRRITFLGSSLRLSRMEARYEGYCAAMYGAGYSPEPYIDCESLGGTAALMRFLTSSHRQPSALFAANNLTLLRVLKAIRSARIPIPQQIAVAGFDDLELGDTLQPSLTVIRQPAYGLGEMAASILFQRILGGEAPQPNCQIMLPFELVVGSSCGCRPPVANCGESNNLYIAAPADAKGASLITDGDCNLTPLDIAVNQRLSSEE
jgi:LacI family transcriptional regulator